MEALGRNIGAETLVRAALAAAAAGTAVNGQAIDITALGVRANSVRAALSARGNLDAADTLIVSAIKLQSSLDVGFTTPVDRVTATNLTLTGATGDTDVDHYGQTVLDLDLTSLPHDHIYIRLTATPTLSDTTNTTGAIGGAMIFGGLDEAPAT